MTISKAQQRAVTKYDTKAYDKTLLRLQKGKLGVVKAHAAARGESVNGFIGRAISEAMERDGGEMHEGGLQEAAGATAGAGVVSLPPNTLKTAQRAAERTGETVVAFVTRAVEAQEKRDDKAFKLGINPA